MSSMDLLLYEMLLCFCGLLIVKGIYSCYWYFKFFDDEYCLMWLLTHKGIKIKNEVRKTYLTE
jgi:hypothetical protein